MIPQTQFTTEPSQTQPLFSTPQELAEGIKEIMAAHYATKLDTALANSLPTNYTIVAEVAKLIEPYRSLTPPGQTPSPLNQFIFETRVGFRGPTKVNEWEIASFNAFTEFLEKKDEEANGPRPLSHRGFPIQRPEVQGKITRLADTLRQTEEISLGLRYIPGIEEVEARKELEKSINKELGKPHRPDLRAALNLDVLQTATLVKKHKEMFKDKFPELYKRGVENRRDMPGFVGDSVDEVGQNALGNYQAKEGYSILERDRGQILLQAILVEVNEKGTKPIETAAYKNSIKRSITATIVEELKDLSALAGDIIEGTKLGIAAGLDRFSNAEAFNEEHAEKLCEDVHKNITKYAEKTGMSKEDAYSTFNKFVTVDNKSPDGRGFLGFIRELSKLTEDIFKGIQKGIKYKTTEMQDMEQ